MLPNFFVIGAAKAGTTSLYHYLGSHPQVFMSPVKEPEYFLASPGDGGLRREMYETLFADVGDAVAVGEASVRYSSHPFRLGVPERIAASIPEAKLIYLVREPVARMVSQWMHNVRIYGERRNVETALPSARYIMLSSYAHQAERYLEYFPPEQLLLVVSEQLRDQRDEALNRIWRFLGVTVGHRAPELAQELNRTATKSMPRRSVRRLRGIRGTGRLAATVPQRLIHATGPYTHERAVNPQLSPVLVHELHLRLHEDVARLRQYVDQPFDGWGIA